jgi:hypothetical protein
MVWGPGGGNALLSAGQVRLIADCSESQGGPGMWGKRKRQCGRLPRQLALGLLEDAMGRVQQQESESGEDEPAVPKYLGAVPPPAAPPGLRAAGVPVDNSAGPEPADPETPALRDLPGSRTRTGNEHRSRHGTFG